MEPELEVSQIYKNINMSLMDKMYVFFPYFIKPGIVLELDSFTFVFQSPMKNTITIITPKYNSKISSVKNCQLFWVS
jgi:hypothetical protein